ncbi:uncharacterized protein DEA37_0015017 [Paragonimus westermani]|uniref:C2H2-type domain-containing protein n=1 Tax=Paragonimus westermani TaxID=34504 RepID=A0A5J4N5G4_9TREM|nr:uncharacterized protein DEA37_0015017 [Paragonimus westermani]
MAHVRSPAVYVIRDTTNPTADVLTIQYNQLKPAQTPEEAQMRPLPVPPGTDPITEKIVEIPAEGSCSNTDGTEALGLVQEKNATFATSTMDPATGAMNARFQSIRHQLAECLPGIKDNWWRKQPTKALVDVDTDCFCTQPENLMKVWRKRFGSLLNHPTTIDWVAVNSLPQQDFKSSLDLAPDLLGLQSAVGQLRSMKATDEDGLSGEILRNGGPALECALLQLVHSIWEHEAMPQDFKDALIVPLFEGKGSKRPVVVARILLNRLNVTILQVSVPEEQCGFRASRSTIDLAFAARQLQEKCRERNQPLYALSVDFTKAFESVSLVVLWTVLGKFGCPDLSVGRELRAHVAKVSAAFGRAWKNHSLKMATKLCVYRSIVLSVLLHGSETWTLCQRNVRYLSRFHSDMIQNTEVLRRAEMDGMEAMLLLNQLCWLGHVRRMDDDRIPKQLLYGQVKSNKRNPGGQKLRYQDVVQVSPSRCNIVFRCWEVLTLNRTIWRNTIWTGVRKFNEQLLRGRERKRAVRKGTIGAIGRGDVTIWRCDVCGRECAGRLGLVGHQRTHSTPSAKRRRRFTRLRGTSGHPVFAQKLDLPEGRRRSKNGPILRQLEARGPHSHFTLCPPK